MLNITDEIMIYLEDKGEQEISSLPFKNQRKYKGGLGRLELQKLVKRRKSNDHAYLSLTAEGNRYIDNILSAIRKPSPSWKEVYLVAFAISEKQRKLRDILRRKLVSLQAKMLVSSLWLCPEDITGEISKFAKKFNIDDKIYILKSIFTEGLIKKISQNVYQSKSIDNDYQRFLSKVRQFLKTGKKETFIAKKLILEYAQIRNLDPKFPSSIVSESKVHKESYEAYKKLRAIIT